MFIILLYNSQSMTALFGFVTAYHPLRIPEIIFAVLEATLMKELSTLWTMANFITLLFSTVK